MHNLSRKNMSQWCHDSQCFGIDLDLETSLTFNQQLIVSMCVDDNIMLTIQSKNQALEWKRFKFLIERF